MNRLPDLFLRWLRQEYPHVPNVERFVAARYDVVSLGAKRGWNETIHAYRVEGRGGRRAPYIEWWHLTDREEAYITEDDERTIKVYDDAPAGWPPNSIPFDRRLAYRGMSWEEWQHVLRVRRVGSAGWYNLGPSQAGRTYFGGDPGQAEHYASGFTPWIFKPAHARPGVVVAVPKAHLRWEDDADRRYNKSPARPRGGEMSMAGSLPIREVVGVWFLVATKVKPGRMELVVQDPRRTSDTRIGDGSRSAPSVDYIIVPAHHTRRKW